MGPLNMFIFLPVARLDARATRGLPLVSLIVGHVFYSASN
jgi:hypothetical protein